MSTIFLAVGKCVSDKSLTMWAKSTAVWRSVTSTCRQPSQRREHHEQIDCPIPLVLIVMPRGLSWLCLDRNARFAGQLLRSLVHADHRILWIVRPLINLQHILHVGYERRVGIRRDDPLFL